MIKSAFNLNLVSELAPLRRGCPIDPAVLEDTAGYAAFEQRRQASRSKQVHAQVLLSSKGLDDGLDRRNRDTERTIKGAHT